MKAKELSVRKIDVKGRIMPESVPVLFERLGIRYQKVQTVNWPDYAYVPKMEFGIVHTGDRILLHYRIEEQAVRAVACHDNDRVWEDSCAEFFVQPAEEEGYYNFECNCAGKLLVEYGRPGDRNQAPLQVTERVLRWASLGEKPFDTRVGDCPWEVVLIIPLSAFFHHSIEKLDGCRMKGNFYKCGDLLPVPHFLSWSPIEWPTPSFHRPECFGELVFE